MKQLQIIKSFFRDLWHRHKLLILLIIPVMLVVKFRDLVLFFLKNSASKLLKETNSKSEILENEERDLQKEAEKILNNIKEKENNKTKVDEDWHLK